MHVFDQSKDWYRILKENIMHNNKYTFILSIGLNANNNFNYNDYFKSLYSLIVQVYSTTSYIILSIEILLLYYCILYLYHVL